MEPGMLTGVFPVHWWGCLPVPTEAPQRNGQELKCTKTHRSGYPPRKEGCTVYVVGEGAGEDYIFFLTFSPVMGSPVACVVAACLLPFRLLDPAPPPDQIDANRTTVSSPVTQRGLCPLPGGCLQGVPFPFVALPPTIPPPQPDAARIGGAMAWRHLQPGPVTSSRPAGCPSTAQ